MDYHKSAQAIYDALGGSANINSLTHCMTRLRFKLKDETQVDDAKVKQIAGVMGVNHQAGQYQIIIGNDVANYYQELVKLGVGNSMTADSETPGTASSDEHESWFNRFANFISACMSPLIPALIGGGMIKVLVILLPLLGWLNPKGSTYAFLTIFGDAPFYFLPIMLAYTSAKYFKVSPMLAVTVAGIMLHPNFAAMVKAGKAVTLMGLPVTLANYSSSVIPILLMVLVMKYLEQIVDRFCPNSMKSILKPLIIIFVAGTLALVLVGPLGTFAGKLLSDIILFVQSKANWLAMPLMAAFMPLIVMTGMHWAFAPIFLAASTAHPDSLILPAMLAANIGQGAAALAVAFKTKNKSIRQVASAASISALVAGVTEPALYGVTLKYKKPLYASMIAGAVTGLFMGLVNLKSFAFAVPSLVSLPQFVSSTNSQNLVNAVIVLVASFIITFVLAYIFGIDEAPAAAQTAGTATSSASTDQTAPATSAAPTIVPGTTNIYAPVAGQLVALEQVPDNTFAKKVLGDGCAIIPSEGNIYAPFDGEVLTIFPTKHALGLRSDTGVELLIHVGLETVNLKGEPFEVMVQDHARIKRGQLLLKADLEAIKAHGCEIITPVVITNTTEFDEITAAEPQAIQPEQVAICCVKK